MPNEREYEWILKAIRLSNLATVVLSVIMISNHRILKYPNGCVPAVISI